MLALLCSVALAGDLWLDIEAKDDDGTLIVHVPANDLGDSDSTIEVNGKKVDLAAEARALKEAGKGEKTFDLSEPGGKPTTLTLSHQEPAKGPAPSWSCASPDPWAWAWTSPFPSTAAATWAR